MALERRRRRRREKIHLSLSTPTLILFFRSITTFTLTSLPVWRTVGFSFANSRPVAACSAVAPVAAGFSHNKVFVRSTARGGPSRTQNCRHFNTMSPSKRLKAAIAVSVTSSTTKLKAKTNKAERLDPSSSSSPSLLRDWVSHRNDYSFHNFSIEEATQIRRALLSWYYVNRRKLPWRGDPPPYDGSTAKKKSTSIAAKNYNNNIKVSTLSTTDSTAPTQTAYGVWVSEIMLQQTRVEAVIPYWLAWMEAFPTIQSLADATPDEVNSKWAGLGFYRRARLLHDAAKYICDKLDGQLPQTPTELQSIPGIGPYTAAAIASISFDVCVPVVDGNVCRVLSRLRCIAQNIKAPILKDKIGWDLAAQIINADGGSNPGDVNQALMELGATYCAPSGTGIDPNDPLRDFYWSTRMGAEYYHEMILSRPGTSSVEKIVREFIQNDSQQEQQVDADSFCPLCSRERMVSVLMELDSTIKELIDDPKSGVTSIDIARSAGHSVFPTSPPKQLKREEVLAVAVLSMTLSLGVGAKAESDTYWLLTKRPAKGLLANQWEFPSTALWNSDDFNSKGDAPPSRKQVNGVKRKKSTKSSSSCKDEIQIPVISPAQRRKAIQELLSDLTSSSGMAGDEIRGANLACLSRESPIEHIFSHIRHTMWIEHATIQLPAKRLPKPIEWSTSSTIREVRWMKESDMKASGVTAGVKKVLNAVQDERRRQNAKEKAAHIAAEKKRDFFQPRSKKRNSQNHTKDS